MSRPDEGLIHAWLDGELDAAEAARVTALVERDPEWAAAAAEARGFIAASSRIVSALDDVPAGVVPKPKAAPVFVKQRHWARSPRFLATAALAATMLVLVNVVPPHVVESPDELAAVALKDVVASAETRSTPGRVPAAVADTQATKERDASARTNQRRVVDEVKNAAATALADAPANPGRAGALGQQEAQVKVQAQSQVQVQSQAAPSLARQQVAATGAGAGGAPADGFRRDVADQRKPDSTAAGKTEDLKKSKVDASAPVVAGAEEFRTRALRTTPAASGAAASGAAANEARRGPQIISMDDTTRLECYRRLGPEAGLGQIERVLRLTDSTVFPLILREEAARAATTRSLAAAPSAPPPTRPAQLLVRRDTLIIPFSNGVTVLAVRTSCPKP